VDSEIVCDKVHSWEMSSGNRQKTQKTAEPAAGKWTGLERTGSTDTACLQAQINPDAGEKRQEHAEQSATE
jgi:hypothetical protein